MTASKLRALFTESNRRFWNSRLPPYRVRRKQLPYHRQGFIDTTRRIIWIDSNIGRTDDGEVRRVLLHEMCHIPQGCRGHGEQWRRQLARLAAKGEVWAEDERARYADAPRSPRISGESVREWMRLRFMIEPDLAVLSWRAQRLAITEWFGLLVTEFSRHYPMARSWWIAAQLKELKRRRR